MTFKDYLSKVLPQTSTIKEFCGGYFRCQHNEFGYDTVPDDGDDGDDGTECLFLYGPDELTAIDINQEITFDGDGVGVVDIDSNKLKLIFYKMEEVPHPTA